MYHYVRDGARVHARTVDEFERQLDYVADAYTCVTLDDVIAGDWPENACLLTFDDGLVEHVETVAPALERRGLTGVFCVPAQPVLERKPLDVQKTQFLLAEAPDHRALGARILAEAGDADELWRANTPPHRFDPPETVFVKRVLQDGLPAEQRRSLLDALFREHVATDDRAFADEVYLTLEGCRDLTGRGHAVVGHGYEHRRLGLLDERAQRVELERTRAFVDDVGGTWALCYPYGSRNTTTIALLREFG